MNSLKNIFFISASLLLLFSACKEEVPDDNPGEQIRKRINPSLQEWITPFNKVNKTFYYSNSQNGSATIKVTHRNIPNDASFVDCQRDNGSFLCEFENTTLEFSSDSDTLMYLTAYLFGEDRLTLNYSDMAQLTPEILRLKEDAGEFENIQPTNFEVEFDSDYSFDGTTKNAFIVNTTTLDNLFGATPPKSFIILKERGIVEWTDYAGQVWTLN